MYNNLRNKQLNKYIKLFSDHLLLGDNSEELLYEFKDRNDFCIDELKFWSKQKNPKRYQQALENYLSWLTAQVEKTI